MKAVIVLFLLWLTACSAVAQKVFTACDIVFNSAKQPLPDEGKLSRGVIRDGQYNYTVFLTVDVKKGNAEVINITILEDATDAEKERIEFNTRENLKKLTFLQDTTNYKIIFNYRFSSTIVNSYAEIVADTVNIIDKEITIYGYNPIHGFSNTKIDSQLIRGVKTLTFTIEGVLTTSTYLHSKSNILLERIIEGDTDSIIIIANNYPELADQLLIDGYGKSKINLLNSFKNDIKCYHFNIDLPKRYFIRYHLHREVCGEHQNR